MPCAVPAAPRSMKKWPAAPAPTARCRLVFNLFGAPQGPLVGLGEDRADEGGQLLRVRDFPHTLAEIGVLLALRQIQQTIVAFDVHGEVNVSWITPNPA